ncbi:MAG: 4-hydroxy-tetrahydrodipicolinate reductase [Dehalococcoidia bacterium]|nr:4-hydroxy-tetrahydrodipicolinate reductase [Dehalococcoidia bacterium]
MAGPIAVVVRGACGRVGREVVSAVARQADMRVVGAIDAAAPGPSLSLPSGGAVPLGKETAPILDQVRPQVLVDFTAPGVVLEGVRAAVSRGVHLVIGTTGLSASEVEEIGRLSAGAALGAIVAPNFALGAVVMMHLAQIAAKYFDYAEIIELHHEQKLDAPSGTAKATAELMAKARGKPFLRTVAEKETVKGARDAAVGGVTLHSVRMPGLVAHQEVLLGALGQTLSIRHDTVSREAFMPGVLLAIRRVPTMKGLIVGLDPLLGL